MTKGPIGKLMPHQKNIHIYGAGISGLLMGYYLKKQGFNIKIFEKNNRVGGLIQSHKINGNLIETAANTLYTNDDSIELLKELKLSYIHVNKGLKRKLMRVQTALSVPFSFSEIFKILINLRKPIPSFDQKTTVADFFKPLLGEKLCHEVLTPMLCGIYSIGSHELQLMSLFPDIQSKHYWGFFKEIRKLGGPV